MKLTSKDIAALEGFLTRAEDSTLQEVATYYGLSKYGYQQLSAAILVLRRVGVAVPPRLRLPPVVLSRADAEAFREWQASRLPPQVQPHN